MEPGRPRSLPAAPVTPSAKGPTMLRTTASILTTLPLLATALPAAADIVHVVPTPEPALERSFTPVPGGPAFIMTGGDSLWAPTADVSDFTSAAWVGTPGGEGGEEGGGGGPPQLWRLQPGDYIGPGGLFGPPISFTSHGLMPVYGFGDLPAEFPATLTRLYGFAALTEGGFRYGWVQVAVTSPAPFDWSAIDVLQYAYESEPGTAIAAGAVPSPAAAALLALGAACTHRRRRAPLA